MKFLQKSNKIISDDEDEIPLDIYNHSNFYYFSIFSNYQKENTKTKNSIKISNKDNEDLDDLLGK